MFKHSIRLYSSVIKNVKGNVKETYSSPTNAEKKWNLFSAVCLERHPIITKPMTEIEKKFQKMVFQIEHERSLMSDFEVRKIGEIKQAEMIKQGKVDVDFDKPVEKTALDIEEAGANELKEFKFGSRTTEADAQNITTSLDRKLDQSLLLLMEQKVGNNTLWIPPQGMIKEGETLRQTAERVLQEHCGSDLSVKFYGNAPIGVYKYKYPRKLQEQQNAVGAKVFYFLAKHLKGNVQEKANYQWLDRTEIQQLLPKGVNSALSYFLIPE